MIADRTFWRVKNIEAGKCYKVDGYVIGKNGGIIRVSKVRADGYAVGSRFIASKGKFSKGEYILAWTAELPSSWTEVSDPTT